ncbi:hypothetical protein KCP74_12690 [Salmonella enterica subsp. enterica]|nr:hypothetical protein KCP74_12690 [Salmonella enterica subsp. enterica]
MRHYFKQSYRFQHITPILINRETDLFSLKDDYTYLAEIVRGDTINWRRWRYRPTKSPSPLICRRDTRADAKPG